MLIHTHTFPHTQPSHSEPHSSFHPVPPRMISDLGKMLPAVIEPIEFIRSLLLMVLFCVLIYFLRGVRISTAQLLKTQSGKRQTGGQRAFGVCRTGLVPVGQCLITNPGLVWAPSAVPAAEGRCPWGDSPWFGGSQNSWFGREDPSVSFHPSAPTLLLPCGIPRAHSTPSCF